MSQPALSHRISLALTAAAIAASTDVARIGAAARLAWVEVAWLWMGADLKIDLDRRRGDASAGGLTKIRSPAPILDSNALGTLIATAQLEGMSAGTLALRTDGALALLVDRTELDASRPTITPLVVRAPMAAVIRAASPGDPAAVLRAMGATLERGHIVPLQGERDADAPSAHRSMRTAPQRDAAIAAGGHPQDPFRQFAPNGWPTFLWRTPEHQPDLAVVFRHNESSGNGTHWPMGDIIAVATLGPDAAA